jgi:hypothetical protein
MMPAFLLPEKIAREDGFGAVVALDRTHGPQLQLTLGITRILERESLIVSIWGSSGRSPDGPEWKQLAAFPRKSFCGTYSLSLDLSGHYGVRFLRAQWEMRRWNGEEPEPLFSFYVWVEELRPKALRTAS